MVMPPLCHASIVRSRRREEADFPGGARVRLLMQLTNPSGTLVNGDAFKLFAAAGYAGQFSSVAGPSPGAGLKWNLNRCRSMV